MKNMKVWSYTVVSCLLLLFQLAVSADTPVLIYGGPPPQVASCISEEDLARMLADTSKFFLHQVPASPTVTLFADPMGDGGMNSPGKPIINYVDLILAGLRDYNCGTATYDGHQGIDILIHDFYEMEEGIPILCAAPGVVQSTRDGQFDRRLSWVEGALANFVIVRHSDNSRAWYYHMRKNSVQVSVGDSVVVGDTLGYVGSSGFSTWPHLHFQVMNGTTVVEPFNGTCQSSPSSWISQGAYTWTYPMELLTHGITTIPWTVSLEAERPPSDIHITDGELVSFWANVRMMRTTDTLKWEIYDNSSVLWNTAEIVPSPDYTFSIWAFGFYLPSSPAYYGNWSVKILHNGIQVGSENFSYDNQPNQLPTIPTTVIPLASINPYQGEFSGTDPDGSIFWYEVASGPTKGTLSQYGGRKRKFTYLPSTSIPGPDTVVLYAVDDDSAIGPNTYYIFDPQCLAKPGDVNSSSGTPNLQDVIHLTNFVFDKDRSATGCLGIDPGNCWTPDLLCRGDVNGSGGNPNLQDVIYLVNFVFDKSRTSPPCNGTDPGNCWTPVVSGVCCLPVQ